MPFGFERLWRDAWHLVLSVHGEAFGVRGWGEVSEFGFLELARTWSDSVSRGRYAQNRTFVRLCLSDFPQRMGRNL